MGKLFVTIYSLHSSNISQFNYNHTQPLTLCHLRINYSAPAADVVPVEEYDELSKLVDRLLTEKAQLQLAVDKQADQLKVRHVAKFLWLLQLNVCRSCDCTVICFGFVGSKWLDP